GAPAASRPEGLHRRPAALLQHCIQGFVMLWPYDGPGGRDGTNQMMELSLDGSQIREDVGVIVFQIIENCGARPIVHKLRALVEECSVVFVGLDDEERFFRAVT